MSLFSGLIKRIGSLKQLRLIVIFFLISLFVWLSSKMSEVHTAKVDIFFDFTDETFEIFRVDEPVQEVEFVISGTGFRLLFARLFTPTVYLSITDIQMDDKGFYFSKPLMISAVESYYRNVLRVNKLMLDRLDAPFFASSIKKIPVRLQEDFILADGYAWSSELNLIPDSLYVSGSAEKVDSLEYAYVVTPTNKEFSTSLDEKLSLTSDLQANYKWSETQVYASQKISRYTQIELRLPIEVLDPVEKIDVSVIPAFAQVSLRVPVQQARQIDPSQFILGCRLPIDTVSEFLVVGFERIPDNIVVNEIKPNQVRYFIN
jgi:hypothetical protein